MRRPVGIDWHSNGNIRLRVQVCKCIHRKGKIRRAHLSKQTLGSKLDESIYFCLFVCHWSYENWRNSLFDRFLFMKSY
jgi:hypothetical protein